MDNARETENIWREFSGQIRGHVLRRINNPGDADDLLQEIFIKIHNNVAGLVDEKKLAPWIYRIVDNTVNDYYRKSPPISAELDENRANIIESDDAAEVAHITKCLNVFVNRLPDKYREALVMSELERVKQKDIARRLGISYSGAKSRVQRGREMLKDMFIACCKFSRDDKGKLVGYGKSMDDCAICG